MIILLTNDDGIYDPGLMALKKSLEGLGELWVVAPAVQQSGMSHAFSVFTTLRVEKVNINGDKFGYSVSGTPADAVKIALRSILPEKPGLVVSGINNGSNEGINVLYSGTIAAAMEGTIAGIPSIAVSVKYAVKQDYTFAARFACQICEKTLKHGLPYGTMLSVNIPSLSESKIKGVKIARQADSNYDEEIEERNDPRNLKYYWIGGSCKMIGTDRNNDMSAIEDNYIAITPIRTQTTDEKMLTELKEWNLE